MNRLKETLWHTITNDDEADVIVVDWGSEIPVWKAVQCQLPLSRRIKIITVPLDITKTIPSNFSEVHALNIGIRRANSDWIGRIDQDTLIGPRFIEWFYDCCSLKHDIEKKAFFSIRRDIPQGERAILPKPPIWNNWNLTEDNFYCGAVGMLLAPTEAWFNVQGYNEKLIHRNHMEHDLCIRFRQTIGLRNLSILLNADFYHQYHERPYGIQENEYRSSHELEQTVTQLDQPNWGFAGEDFEEVIV